MNVNTLTRFVGKMKLGFINHSPELLVIGGIALGVTSTVMACKATKKVDDILEKHNAEIEKIHKGKEMVESGELSPEEYSDKDIKRDTIIAYRDTAFAMAKNYGPAILIGGLAIAAELTGFGILRSRYLALGAAYTALDNSFKAYRKRVVDEAGKDADRHYMYGTKIEEIKVTEMTEDGKTKTKKEKVEVIGEDSLYSPFAKIFDECNPNYSRDASMNRFFIAKQMKAMDKKLKDDGYLFLNTVYKALGFPQTQAGTLFGWVYDPENDEHEGDSYVNFDIFNVNKSKNVDFINGYEPSVIIDFNVDENPIANLLPMAVC